MFLRLVLAAACFVTFVDASYARTPQPATLNDSDKSDSGAAVTFGGKAAIPIGYYQLCRTGSAVCRKLGGADQLVDGGVVRLDGRLIGELARVNSDVNRSIHPISDMSQYRVADRWSVSPKAGDCEDFALTKKARLLKLGWPSSALLIALADTAAGEEHAVLIARTDRGDFVLDNLRKDVRRWSARLYRWKAIQSPTDVWAWYQFGKGTVRIASNTTDAADRTLLADRTGGPDERVQSGVSTSVGAPILSVAPASSSDLSRTADVLAPAAKISGPDVLFRRSPNLFPFARSGMNWPSTDLHFALLTAQDWGSAVDGGPDVAIEVMAWDKRLIGRTIYDGSVFSRNIGAEPSRAQLAFCLSPAAKAI